MSGLKNYQRYRVEVARLSPYFYLASAGRDKVGFSVTGQDSGGRPVYLRGVRGVVERNTMRYFMALSCGLQFASTEAPAQRFAQMAPCWFDETERYPQQLHDLGRAEYLEMKRGEYGRLGLVANEGQ